MLALFAAFGLTAVSACDDGAGEERDLRDAGPETNARIGSLAALELVRARMPEGQLVRVSSDSIGALDADGRDHSWGFRFVDDASARATFVSSYGRTSSPADVQATDQRCGDGEEMRVLDSERVVPDAVARLEARMGERFAGNLFLTQEGCQERPEHYVTASRYSSTNRYYVRYDDEGRFQELAGPCAKLDLASCLAGLSR